MGDVRLPVFVSVRRDEIALLCVQHRVLRLELFGSAVRDDFQPESSDLDFIVAFDDLTPGEYSDSYFKLREGLELMFNRPVDLMTARSLSNPYLRNRVNAERVTVYCA